MLRAEGEVEHVARLDGVGGGGVHEPLVRAGTGMNERARLVLPGAGEAVLAHEALAVLPDPLLGGSRAHLLRELRAHLVEELQHLGLQCDLLVRLAPADGADGASVGDAVPVGGSVERREEAQVEARGEAVGERIVQVDVDVDHVRVDLGDGGSEQLVEVVGVPDHLVEASRLLDALDVLPAHKRAAASVAGEEEGRDAHDVGGEDQAQARIAYVDRLAAHHEPQVDVELVQDLDDLRVLAGIQRIHG